MPAPHRNVLDKEKSPYLLQHKDNPVHWFAWGGEAFEAARRDNKPIFLSIGYSTCHWCHVMEKDSFEKQDVADILNRHFVSIKVDREERPDVDQLYMDAVVGMTGHGGWPLSAFLTPDLKPFFAGTFFWQPQFMTLLVRIAELWRDTPEKLRQSAEDVLAFLHAETHLAKAEQVLADDTLLQKAFDQLQGSFDAQHGGFGGAPKFPRSMDLSLLLRMHRRTGDASALDMVTTTLNHMACGGIYDHLGGGFHRYATDREWRVPHFEKMLYDNAELAFTYLEAYQVTHSEMFREVACEILHYVLRDMTSPAGGFYSAEDADSEGKEGTFYIWTEAELKRVLNADEYHAIKELYGISKEGNFEDSNILHLARAEDWSLKHSPRVQAARAKLFAAREHRVHPYKDDKILTSWNGLMIAALCKASQVLGEARFREAALNCAQFIETALFADARLYRRYRDGERRFAANLEDYAFLIHGLLFLYEATLDTHWLAWAETLQTLQDERFWDIQDKGYFTSEAGASDLIVRKKDVNDGAIPSGNAIAALNLLRLHTLTTRKPWRDRAEELLAFLAPRIANYPMGFSQALIAVDFAVAPACKDGVCLPPL